MLLKSQGAELKLGVKTDLAVQGHQHVPHREQEKAGDPHLKHKDKCQHLTTENCSLTNQETGDHEHHG